MDEEKLEDAITSLELAVHQLRTFCDNNKDLPGTEVLNYSVNLVRESLELLRNLEVKREIDHFSEDGE